VERHTCMGNTGPWARACGSVSCIEKKFGRLLASVPLLVKQQTLEVPSSRMADILSLVVLAEDQEALKYEWRVQMRADAELRDVAEQWAQAHGCDPESVGLEDEDGIELDMSSTGRSLGWVDRQGDIRITAFPTAEEEREQVDAAAEDNQPEAPGGDVNVDGGAAGSAEAPLEASEAAAEEAAQPQAEEAAEDGAADEQGEAEEADDAEVAQADSAAAPEGEDQTASAAGASAEAKNAAKGSAKKVASPARSKGDAKAKAKASEASAKAKAKAKAKGKAQGKAAPAPKAKAAAAKAKPPNANAATPAGADKIKFIDNPKRQGSAAYDRYEGYKKAKTVDEAIRKGATQGDISHDFAKGFLQRA